MSPAKKKKTDSTKGDVIHIRTAPSDKSLIERAAENLGLSVSSFILQYALKAARRELAEVERISLSEADARIFFSALESPPAPNAALQSAFRDYTALAKKRAQR
jgi:uncharacterized protein (DUF1778 family)